MHGYLLKGGKYNAGATAAGATTGAARTYAAARGGES